MFFFLFIVFTSLILVVRRMDRTISAGGVKRSPPAKTTEPAKAPAPDVAVAPLRAAASD